MGPLAAPVRVRGRCLHAHSGRAGALGRRAVLGRLLLANRAELPLRLRPSLRDLQRMLSAVDPSLGAHHGARRALGHSLSLGRGKATSAPLELAPIAVEGATSAPLELAPI